MSRSGRLRRYLARLALGLLLLVSCAAALLLWLTASASGRAVLLGAVLGRVNAAIPGELQVRELARLDLAGVELVGIRALDPGGAQVLALERLAVALDARELVGGRVVVSELLLADGEVDLRELAQKRRGLVAAFVDPDAPASPPSDEPPPYVRAERIELRRLALRAPELGALGQLDVRELEMDAGFELDGTPFFVLRRLGARLEREGETLGRLHELSGTLARGSDPSVLGLDAEVAGMRLQLDAELVAPPEPSWRQSPLGLTLDVSGVSGETLSRLLRDPALKEAVSGSLSLQAQALGTPDELLLKLELGTAAGAVTAHARLDELKRGALVLAARDLELQRLRADLPARRLTLHLAGSADAERPDLIPITLALRDSLLDDTPLPTLDLSCNVTPRGAQGVALSLKDGQSHARVEGDAQLSGAVQLRLLADVERGAIDKWKRFAGLEVEAGARLHADLRITLDEQRLFGVTGKLTARQLVFGANEIEAADVEVALRGEPARPVGRLSLRLERAMIDGQAVPRVALVAQGGPTDYQLALDADFGAGTAAAQLELGRFAERVELRGRGEGTLRGEPWKLAIGPTRVTTSGELRTDGIDVDVAGLSASVRGRFSQSGGELDLTTGSLELEKLSRLLKLAEPLRGRANLAVRLSGTPATPRVDLKLTGQGLSLGDRPGLDLGVEAGLDSLAGTLDAQVRLGASQPEAGQTPLDVELSLSHRFKGGRAWSSALSAGDFDATLSLNGLDSRFVQAWARKDSLPAAGTLAGSVRVTGNREDPRLEARLTSNAEVLGAALSLESTVSYAQGSGQVSLAVSDARGAWVAMDAGLDLGSDTLGVEQLAQRLPRAGADEHWRVTLDVHERNLNELPGLTRGEAPPVAAAATLRVLHAPGAEPEGSLTLTARPTWSPDGSLGSGCELGKTLLTLESELSGGELKAEILALDGDRRLLHSRVEAPLRLAPALEGKPLELGAVQAKAEARNLSLQTLPLVCGLARGVVDAQLTARDALGPSPQLDAELSVRNFSLGSPQTVDLRLRAAVNRDKASADAEISAGRALSTLRAELPFEKGRPALGKDAPLSVDVVLRDLPIAPFLDPKGAVSYASGSVDGNAEARGSLASPKLRGKLVLKDIAFTATSLAQPLRDVKGTVELTHDKVVLRGFEARDQDGVLKLAGEADFRDTKHVKLELDVGAREFPLRQQGQVVATAQLEAKVKTEVRPSQTDVTIELGAVDLWIESTELRTGVALEQHPDFVVDGKGSAPKDGEAPPPERAGKAEKTTATAAPRLTTLALRAEDGVWVKRGDFAVKLAANLTTRIRGDQTHVEGRVSILRGYLDLMGKTFDIDKQSYLHFTGSPTPDPTLAITAAHQNRRSGASISVAITGRASAPVLTFRVDDRVVSAGDAFQAIYGSEQSNQDPKNANNQARAFVGGLTAGLLATTARRELGAAAPIIMIEPGQQGEGRIRAGFELDSLVPKLLRNVVTGVYFEGIVANESSGEAGMRESDARVQTGFLLELYFPYNFFSAAQRGPGPTWSVDVGWQL